ncbi:MAG TPA: hypothetical protein VGQ78_04985, partial [Vicinamibacteria bacterium]|nr:hypothetical protein [Vicinamibacteria bacterium]
MGQTTCIEDKDHFFCWGVKDLGQPPFGGVLGVPVQDPFGGLRNVDVIAPQAICTTADVRGSGVARPDRKICCYGIDAPALATKKTSVQTTDQFGTLLLGIRKPLLLCEPCAGTVV